MTKTVFQLRLSVQELERWKRLAPGSVSGWVKRLVNEECDRVEAERADVDHVRRERIAMVQSLTPLVEPASGLVGSKPFRPDFKK